MSWKDQEGRGNSLTRTCRWKRVPCQRPTEAGVKGAPPTAFQGTFVGVHPPGVCRHLSDSRGAGVCSVAILRPLVPEKW